MQNRTYRYFNGKVQYPFGYGKTYTKFALKDTEAYENKIRATVKNVGNFENETVLQLYVTYPTADFKTPIRSLIDCKRILLKPQEEKEFEFEFDETKLLTVNDDGEKVLLKGIYNFILSDGCDFESKAFSYFQSIENK